MREMARRPVKNGRNVFTGEMNKTSTLNISMRSIIQKEEEEEDFCELANAF